MKKNILAAIGAVSLGAMGFLAALLAWGWMESRPQVPVRHKLRTGYRHDRVPVVGGIYDQDTAGLRFWDGT